MSVDGTEIEDKKPFICLRDLSNYRERNMPTSPSEVKANSLGSPNSQVSPGHLTNHQQRPLSTGSNYSGVVNGLPSPVNSSHNSSPETNRSPSPSLSLGGSTMAQQLPPACGARQLSKLKRFLTTLIQFGSDISMDIGDRVRALVLALVNNHLSVEEFHSKLQEATNFPLRPFVIPFLKANLPLLQRELLYCARVARQTPQQYLANHEHLVFDPGHTPLALHLSPSSPDPQRLQPHDLSTSGSSTLSNNNVLNQNGKRPKASLNISPKENESGSPNDHVNPPPAKRPHSSSTSSQSSPTSLASPLILTGSLRLDELGMQRGTERSDRLFSPFVFGRQSGNSESQAERLEEEWKHLESMLHCIMDMVGRCRHALTAIQERVRHEREELARWLRHSGADPDVKKKADHMTESLRNTEDRVTDMRRRAVHVFPEEAVNEVKRQALLELQKAVATAELKASELVAAERVKMERAIAEAQRQAKAELQQALSQQLESSETCWNCGRKASETCSGCNVARYCGAFCQHKDWERHHKVCRQQASSDASSSPQNALASPTMATASMSPGREDTLNSLPRDGSRSPTNYTSLSSRQSPHEAIQDKRSEQCSLKETIKCEEGSTGFA